MQYVTFGPIDQYTEIQINQTKSNTKHKYKINMK